MDRRTSFELTVTGGQLYLTVGGQSFSGEVAEHRLDGV